MKLWFITKDGYVKCVCQVEHRSKQCKRPHCVPSDALVQVTIKDGTEGDLKEYAREKRKKERSSVRHWQRQKRRVEQAYARAAPAFKAHAKTLVDEVMAQKPINCDYSKGDLAWIRKRWTA